MTTSVNVLDPDGLAITVEVVAVGPPGEAAGAHAATHQAGGSDPLPLDSLAAPSDSTLLDATGTLHGLMAKTDKAKLDAIEAGATADQTAGEIKTAYESNADTNAYTDAEQSKLSFIEDFAEQNAGQNIGAGGVPVFDGKVGSTLQFRSIDAATPKIEVVANVGDNEVEIDLGMVASTDLTDTNDLVRQVELTAHEDDQNNPHAVTAAQAGADPAGSAAAVQTALDAHEDDQNNPHAVTAAQAGADPAGSAAAVQTALDAHEADQNNPHAVTAAQAGADPAGSAAAVQTALDAHEADQNNPHAVTAAQAGAHATGSYLPVGDFGAAIGDVEAISQLDYAQGSLLIAALGVLQSDAFAFLAPQTVEEWDGSSWVPYTGPNLESLFDGSSGDTVVLDSYPRIRFVMGPTAQFMGGGYFLLKTSGLPAENVRLHVELSDDGVSGWTTLFDRTTPTRKFYSLWQDTGGHSEDFYRIEFDLGAGGVWRPATFKYLVANIEKGAYHGRPFSSNIDADMILRASALFDTTARSDGVIARCTDRTTGAPQQIYVDNGLLMVEPG